MATHSPAHTPGHGHDHAHDHQPGGHHIIEPAVYYKVFGGLMVLLVITLVAAYFDLGSLNLAIAMSIAIAKVVLIVLFFMHLRYSTKLVQFFAGAAGGGCGR